MPRTFHFLPLAEGSPHAPREARRLADRLGRVVAAVSAAPMGATVATDQPCAEPGCRGTLWAEREGDAVVYRCPHCARGGRILEWQGSRWDRSRAAKQPVKALPVKSLPEKPRTQKPGRRGAGWPG